MPPTFSAVQNMHPKRLNDLAVPSGSIMPVIVGGLAVEIYTRNEYTTADIDLVLSDKEVANDLLLELSFEKEGRYWYHPVLGISIEIPGSVLEDADHEKIIKVNLPSGKHMYVIGIEDIILDRLRACVHWRSASDWEWGFRMYQTHLNKLDVDYMRKRAEDDLASEKLNDWLSR